MLTDDQKLLIRQLRADGLPYERIGNMTGHSTPTVREIAWDVIQPASEKKECWETEECRKVFHKIKRQLRRYKAAMQTGTLKPCEQCRWNMNKAPRPVCVVCYREVLRK